MTGLMHVASTPTRNFLVCINEADSTCVISMEKEGNMKKFIDRFCCGLNEVCICIYLLSYPTKNAIMEVAIQVRLA
jgi:hypothetical protein